jgi:CheY-like chemotaxis protein
MLKVAIVDDATFIREIFRQIALRAGWHLVWEAEDGEEAIEKIRENPVDLIFMDIVLPKINGIEASRIILQQHKVKIIACSTVDQEEILIKAMDAGCCSYVTKPFQLNEIIKVVGKIFKE